MAKIIVLPEDISNKIAAGEVVERPASVVKELIENAVDAGATKIELDIKDGGLSFIRVADNGCGMSDEDALLCLQRHATSKIKSDDDLFSIKTLGFRGEALPSMAAVSRMKITTCLPKSGPGRFVSLEAGQIKENRQTGAAPGTVIEVVDLFFNTPARRKFLKSRLTEAGHITDIVTRYALSYPEIHFVLTSGKQQIYLLPPVKTIAERIRAIWNHDFFRELIPLAQPAPQVGPPETFLSSFPLSKSSFIPSLNKDGLRGINITGFVAKPSQNRASRAGQYIFINKRPVRSPSISHALSEGFQGLLTKGRFPVAFLLLEIDPAQIDVNVHPTKREVKLSQEKVVHDLISKTVRDTLKTHSLIPSVLFPETERAQKSRPGYQPAKSDYHAEKGMAPGTTQKPSDRKLPGPIEELSDKKLPDTDRTERIKQAVGEFLDKHLLAAEPKQKYLSAITAEERTRKEKTGPAVEKDKERLPQILHIFGQLDNSYILCQIEDGLLIIDQHAAHERIIYERLRQSSKDLGREQQPLLIPVTLELTRQEALYLEDNLVFWEELGFDLEGFGPDTFILRGLPQVCQQANLIELVRDIIGQLQEEDIPAQGPQTKEKLITMMACKLAAKAGQELKLDEMLSLINQLTNLNLPYTCPHGRPSMIRLSISELAKRFHRT